MNLLKKYILHWILWGAGWTFLLAQDMPDFGLAKTVITSDQLEMENRETSNHFFFKGRVKIEGSNMQATCDEMQVISKRPGDKGASAAGSPDAQFGAIEIIIATGNVTIKQTGRKATATRAEIHPDKDYLELKGNVILETDQGLVSGPHFILEKGKRARMVGNAIDGRPRVVLPGLPDLGVSKEDLLKNEKVQNDSDGNTVDKGSKK